MTTPTHEEFKAALDELNNCGDNYYSIHRHWPAIRHALQAMSDPEWQLVPKEPIIQMLQTAMNPINQNRFSPVPPGQDRYYLKDIHKMADCYRDMLSAAPKYPGETK